MSNPSRLAEVVTYVFIKVSVNANDKFDQSTTPGKLEPDSKLDLKVADESATHFFAVSTVTIGQNESKLDPYVIEVVSVGEFKVSPITTPDVEARNRIALNTAHQVLYAAAREMIANITGRSVFGSVSLGLLFLQVAQPAPQAAVKKATAKKVLVKKRAAPSKHRSVK